MVISNNDCLRVYTRRYTATDRGLAEGPWRVHGSRYAQNIR